jgi:hypothetical protein
MPWHVAKSGECPSGEPWAVVKDADGEIEGCHETEAAAEAQMAALYAAEEGRQVEDMNKLRQLWAAVGALIDRITARAWSGAASNYASTEAYCSACLIDVNSAADRDEKAQSHCMLPYKRPGGDSADREGMHAAAQRFGQVKKPSDVPGDAWSAAVKSAANKLISAYNSHDEQAPDAIYEAAGKSSPSERERAIALGRVRDQLWTMLSERETWSFPLDVYFDGGELYAIVAEDGKLYRVGLAVDGESVSLGEWLQVTEIHEPIQPRSRIFRQADGTYRWLNISAVAVLNRVAEIDSRALFDSFIARAEETGEYPQRDFFHLGDPSVIGQTDLLLRDDAVLISGGLFNDTPLAGAVARAIAAEPDAWGDSISYVPSQPPDLVEITDGVSVPVYSAGVLRHISTLPERRAASLFTTATVKEVMRMRQEIKDALYGLKEHGLPEDEIEALIAQVDGTNRTVEEDRLINREDEAEQEPEVEREEVESEVGEMLEADAEPEAAEEDEEPEAEVAQAAPAFELDDEAVSAIAAKVVEATGLDTFGTQLDELAALVEGIDRRLNDVTTEAQEAAQTTGERLEALEADEDEKKERWQADLPRRQPVQVSYRPKVDRAPETLEKKPRRSELADVAESTLASMPRY